MRSGLEKLTLDTWFKVPALFGALAVAAIVMRDHWVFVLCLGAALIFAGEWANRGVLTALDERRGGIWSATVRHWRPEGLVCDLIGTVLLLIGAYHVLWRGEW